MDSTNEIFEEGDVVYLTKAGHDWISRTNPGFSIPLSGRIGKVEKVLDWTSKEGKLVLKSRVASGKWDKYKSEDFKYIVAIYYPELIMDGHAPGVKAPEVLPYRHPTEEKNPPLFQKWNPDLWKDILRTSKPFSIEEKEDGPVISIKPRKKEAAPAKPETKRRLRVVSRSSGR